MVFEGLNESISSTATPDSGILNVVIELKPLDVVVAVMAAAIEPADWTIAAMAEALGVSSSSLPVRTAGRGRGLFCTPSAPGAASRTGCIARR